ncbi:MAG: N-acetyltransferase [Candidatus Altiarchaeota archaeon]|nr:N-acetyltransferase [Candidatus Altiarchaeota archaeon]
MKVIKARVKDVPKMKSLIEYHAKKNKMLARSLSYLYENLRDYFVAFDGDEIVGCVSLHISWEDLAEVKSLAVAPERLGKGVGRELLKAAIEEATDLGIQQLFTLTLEPEYFIKHGFTVIHRDNLPMKVWGECIHCPKYPECDETALTYDIGQTKLNLS